MDSHFLRIVELDSADRKIFYKAGLVGKVSTSESGARLVMKPVQQAAIQQSGEISQVSVLGRHRQAETARRDIHEVVVAQVEVVVLPEVTAVIRIR